MGPVGIIGVMTAEQLYQSRQADWQKLTALLDRSQNSVKALSPEEVNELSRLYRAAASDLALAQRDFPRHQVTAYLNQLVARAHAVVYQGEPLAWNRLRHFVTAGFPHTFRRLLPFFVAAFLLFMVPAITVGITTGRDPEASRWLLPPQAQQLIPLLEQKELWTNIPVEERPGTSSFIMRNNIQVSFMAFAGGMLAGLFTLYIMAFNGLFLGGVMGLTAYYGVGFDLLTFVIGHGVVELSVIFMAGGAGLAVGWAMLRPGLLRRRDAVTIAARQAVRLIVGCVPLLVLAGLIEGFISPNETIPWPVKFGVGIGTGVVLYAYLFLAGREDL